ncbi:MAG: YqiA/YcfP family alpha/beta fold hydrolase [Spirulina sp.]
MYYLYLHGFASSPRSRKAQYLRDRFAEIGIPLQILDLNRGDFSHLTLSRQLQQAKEALDTAETPITIIGSSFGGLTAAWLAQQHSQIQQIVCLAPAFEFCDRLSAIVGEENLQQWQKNGYLPIHHYGENRRIPLHYEFLRDLQHYPDSELQGIVPTLIVHGRQDATISIQASRNYQKHRPHVKLVELESDHTLGNVLPQIWQEIWQFCLSEETSI